MSNKDNKVSGLDSEKQAAFDKGFNAAARLMLGASSVAVGLYIAADLFSDLVIDYQTKQEQAETQRVLKAHQDADLTHGLKFETINDETLATLPSGRKAKISFTNDNDFNLLKFAYPNGSNIEIATSGDDRKKLSITGDGKVPVAADDALKDAVAVLSSQSIADTYASYEPYEKKRALTAKFEAFIKEKSGLAATPEHPGYEITLRDGRKAYGDVSGLGKACPFNVDIYYADGSHFGIADFTQVEKPENKWFIDASGHFPAYDTAIKDAAELLNNRDFALHSGWQNPAAPQNARAFAKRIAAGQLCQPVPGK